MTDRIAIACDACGQVDDHLRHITYFVAKHPVTGKNVDMTLSQHLDCCAAAGCHNGWCAVTLDHAGDKRGHDLIAHVESAPADLHARYRDELGITTPHAPQEG